MYVRMYACMYVCMCIKAHSDLCESLVVLCVRGLDLVSGLGSGCSRARNKMRDAPASRGRSSSLLYILDSSATVVLGPQVF